MSYLRYMYLFAHSGVPHILCCVFALFFFVFAQCPKIGMSNTLKAWGANKLKDLNMIAKKQIHSV
jgi:membrane associated rhomboid family serine protease